MLLGSAERRKVRLIIREIIRIPTRVITIHQRYRRTDGQTTYHGSTALRYRLRAVKTKLTYRPPQAQSYIASLNEGTTAADRARDVKLDPSVEVHRVSHGRQRR